jgi:hypothetical protein
VVDRGGAGIGEIDDLVIDEEERRVRLLQVGSGGFRISDRPAMRRWRSTRVPPSPA